MSWGDATCSAVRTKMYTNITSHSSDQLGRMSTAVDSQVLHVYVYRCSLIGILFFVTGQAGARAISQQQAHEAAEGLTRGEL